MKYPSRGLPERESDRAALIRVDGTVAPLFERTFRRRQKGAITAESRATLERCQLELRNLLPTLSGDARRYFERVQVLIRLALADA